MRRHRIGLRCVADVWGYEIWVAELERPVESRTAECEGDYGVSAACGEIIRLRNCDGIAAITSDFRIVSGL